MEPPNKAEHVLLREEKNSYVKVQYNHKQKIKEFILNVDYSFAVHSAYIYVYMFLASHWR